MKKSLKRFLVIGLFLLGFAFTSQAYICATIRIFCPDGSGTIGVVCGNNYDELNEEAVLMWDAVCLE